MMCYILVISLLYLLVFLLQPMMDLWEQVRYMVDVPLVSTNNVKDSRTDYRTQAAFVQKGREYLEQM